MNALDFWILDSAVDNHIRVRELKTSHCETLLEMSRPREVNDEQVVDALSALYQRGDVSAVTTIDGTRFGDIIASPLPTRAEIAQSIANPKIILGYGLTEQGSSRWEKCVHPQWELYRSWWSDADGENKLRWIDVEAMEMETVEAFVTIAQKEGSLIEESVKRERLAPWKPTYWKTLPYGHSVRFQQAAGGYSPRFQEWYRRPQF